MIGRELVLQAISEQSDQIVAFARELIAVPTENPPGNAYRECVELLEDRLRGFGLPVEVVRLSPDRAAVIAGVGEGPTLFLHGHYDVVPASTPGQFTPSLEGLRLRGRGSADMKGGIASMAFALVAVSELRLGGRVELVLVPDEETGGEGGSRRLAELGRLGRNGVGAILGEPTSGRIWNASRGALTLRVTVRGRPAHVGLHYQGSNAFEAALPVLQALRGLKEEVERHRTSFRIAPEAATASILMLGGEVTGGHQFNVVPDRFSFSVERRFNPEENLEAERSRMLAVLRDSTPAGVDVEIHVVQQGSSHAVSEDTALVRALGSAVEEVCGSPTPCELCPGLLESRFYADAGVPAVAYGPGELDVSHGPNESVAVERLTECARVYALAALDLLGAR